MAIDSIKVSLREKGVRLTRQRQCCAGRRAAGLKATIAEPRP
jgi:hypothetical protein